MAHPVLVRSSMRTWDFTLLLILGVALLVAAGGVAAGGHTPAGVLLAAAACACVLGSVLGRRWRIHRRRWVEDQGTGFRVLDASGERAVADDEVLSMALHFRRNYANGLLKSETRRFRVWLATDDPPPECLEMTNTIPTGAADPLADLITRLGNRLFEFAKEDRSAGRSVLGEHWSLQGNELTIRGKRPTVTCTVAEVAAVDSVDNHICVWRTGEDEACARVPAASANAHLLWRLLAEELAQRPTPTTPPAEGHLGRIIFERRQSRASVLAFLFFAVPLGLVGLFLVLFGDKGVRWGGAACLAGTGVCILGWLHARRAAFRCHQYGVYKSTLFGARQLRYAELAAFTYNAVRHFHNGAYTGSSFQLGFEPVPEQKANRIRYGVTMRNADQQLENLRDQVSRMLAARMAQRLAAKEPVRWTPHLRFVPEGIEYQAGGLFGRKEPVVIRFADVLTYRIDQGTFYLWTRGQKKPVLKEAMTQPNFFPGFFLLTSIVPLATPGDGAAVS